MGRECSNKSRNAFYYICGRDDCHLLLEQGAHGRRERIFPHVLIYLDCLEEHIIWTYRLPSHVIFNLLQEKRWLGTLNEESRNTRSIKTNSKPSFFGLWFFQHSVAPLFLYSIFVTTNLRCAWYIAWSYVNETLYLCSFICALFVNHPQKFPLPLAPFSNCTLSLICPV